MSDRADTKECINRLHERIAEIEKRFNIRLSEEDRDLFNDLKRDILVPLQDSISIKSKSNKRDGNSPDASSTEEEKE